MQTGAPLLTPALYSSIRHPFLFHPRRCANEAGVTTTPQAYTHLLSLTHVYQVLAKRKGFVRVALEAGASLVPVIFFGENDLYDTHIPQKGTFLHRLQTCVGSKKTCCVPPALLCSACDMTGVLRVCLNGHVLTHASRVRHGALGCPMSGYQVARETHARQWIVEACFCSCMHQVEHPPSPASAFCSGMLKHLGFTLPLFWGVGFFNGKG